MPPTTVTITGKVLGPSGSPARGGRIRIHLVDAGSVEDGSVTQIAGGETVVPIAADGTVNFPIIPNALISPSSSYEATFECEGSRWQRSWIVPTSPSTQHVGDL